MARLPGPDLNNLTSPSGPNSIVDLAERRIRPPLLPPPPAPPVPQKALASLYAFGKSPAHFRICVIPASPTCFLKPSSLTHASFFLVPLMVSMALRCGACILAILHKCPAPALPEPAGFLVAPPPPAPPVPQKALASLYAFGKSPAHFRICVIPASPTCFLKPSSLTHASFFLVPLMASMALRCGACCLA